jgi:20S proteasome subunit beta 3
MLLLLITLITLITNLFKVDCNSIHGGTYLAMAGNQSVILACDSRFSSQQTGTMLLGKHPRNIFRIGSRIIVGCYGLESDTKTLMNILREKFSGHYDSTIEPQHAARLISNILYENRLICSPIIAGLQTDKTPYICCMDGIGAQTVTNDFGVVGTASSGLFAMLESSYKYGLNSEDLIGIAEKALRLALQRDVLSGCDLRIFTIHNDSIYLKEFESPDV